MIATLDALLRSEGRFSPRAAEVSWRELTVFLCCAGFLYGAVMGSFGIRPLQMLYSGIKVPLLLGLTSLVCLPNFFVLNSVLGLREDFGDACRGVLAAQAVVGVTLASLAPLVALTYASSSHYDLCVLSNGIWFAIATLAGQMALTRYYRDLEARSSLHRVGRIAWVILYVFVAIQLAWVMRPYVGNPELPTEFFRAEAFTNAYVTIAEAIWSLLVTGG